MLEYKNKIDDASGRGTVAGFKVPFPAIMQPYSDEEIKTVMDVMKKSEGQTQGEYLRRFESDFKTYIGAEHVFAVDNATNALFLASLLTRIGPGDEVIIPAYTFCATAIPFGKTGAKIVWADIDEDTWTVDPKDIERKITGKTKVIVAVHLLGMPADMPRICEIAEKNSIKVVEDCAQAPGASINGKKVGTFGDYGIFSFHGAKNMTTLGEGGMLIVKSDKDAELIPGLRHNGVRAYSGERKRYWVPAMSDVDIDIPGIWPNNYCIGEAQCALGSVELKRLDKTNNSLIKQAEKIKEKLKDMPEISFAKIPKGYRHVFHQFVMHFDGILKGDKLEKSRDDLLDILVNKYKIRCIVQYYPLYRYPLFKKMGASHHDCPVLENWWDNSFSFPWWNGISDETINFLVFSLKEAIEELKKG